MTEGEDDGEGENGTEGDGTLSEDEESLAILLVKCIGRLCGAVVDPERAAGSGSSISAGTGSGTGSGLVGATIKTQDKKLILRSIMVLNRLANRFRTLDSTAGIMVLRILRLLVAPGDYMPVIIGASRSTSESADGGAIFTADVTADDAAATAAAHAAVVAKKGKLTVRTVLRPGGHRLASNLIQLLSNSNHLKDHEVIDAYVVLHKIADSCGGRALRAMVRGGLALKLKEKSMAAGLREK